MLKNSNCHQNEQTGLSVGTRPDDISSLIDSFTDDYYDNSIADGRFAKISIKGVPAAPGVAVGHAIIINSPKDLKRVRQDSIIVCSRMYPSYSVAFSMVQGIVSERGGVLSNPATIAREYGLPVVIGVKSIQRVISNGDLIEINGDTGCIQVILKAQQYKA